MCEIVYNILITNLKSIARITNESTRVEPFRTYSDLEKMGVDRKKILDVNIDRINYQEVVRQVMKM